MFGDRYFGPHYSNTTKLPFINNQIDNRLQMALVSNTRKTIHRTVSFYSQEKHFENGHLEIFSVIIMGLRVEIQFEQSMS